MNDNLLRRIALLLFIVFLVTSSFVGGYFFQSKKSLNSLFPSLVDTKPNSLFTSQLATIQGKITAVEDKEVVVENNSGSSGKFPIGLSFQVYKFPANGTISTPSGDLKEIDIDRDATIGLSAIGNNFEVTSVYYYETPSLSPPPPSTEASPLPKASPLPTNTPAPSLPPSPILPSGAPSPENP